MAENNNHETHSLLVKRENIHIGFSHFKSLLWSLISHQAREKAEKLGIKLTISTCSNISDQIKKVENLITKKIDALLIFPIESNNQNLIALIKKCSAAGIPIIAAGSEIGEQSESGLIASDNWESSRKIVDYLFKTIGEKGQVAHLQGFSHLGAHRLRSQAFHQVLAGHPNIQLVFENTIEKEYFLGFLSAGKESTKQALQKYPDIKGIVADTDLLALGAIAAIEEAGLTGKICVTGFDGLPDTLLAIHSGTLTATIRQSSEEIAEQALNLALKVIGDKNIPEKTLIPTELINSENVLSAIEKSLKTIPSMMLYIADSNEIQQNLYDEQQSTLDSLQESESRFRNLTALSSDWYWEQDKNFKFTFMSEGVREKTGLIYESTMGKTRWEIPRNINVLTKAEWDAHRAILEAHKPFYDLIFKLEEPGKDVSYVSISGEPVFNTDGKFTGYRGIGKDITGRKKAEEALRESEERFRSLTALSSDWYWQQDENYRFTFMSDVILGNNRGKPEDYIGKTRWEVPIHDDVMTEKEWAEHKAMLDARLPFNLIIKKKAPDGRVTYTNTIGQPFFDKAGNFKGYRGIGKNVTEQKRAEEILRESEERFRSLTGLSSDWYWEQDENYCFTAISEIISEKIGADPADLIGKKRWDFPTLNMSDKDWAEHIAILDTRQPFYNLELKKVSPTGKIVYNSVSGEPIFDTRGNFKGYRGIGKNITERKLAEERIHYLAFHDELTSLPNRTMFTQRAEHAITKAKRNSDTMVSILFIDLDRFKVINDTLGHSTGDYLLQEIAKRLTNTLRESDTVARLGGDEFIVLLEAINDPKYTASIARKILTNIIQPIVISGQEYQITASIGISNYPNDGQDGETLMKNADIAMYLAKEHGKNNYQFYSAQMNVHSFERLALESNLRRALENEELELHYQPKLDILTNKITGMEALIRWKHPYLGMILPEQFISIAEETGLIIPIGKWVLKTACAQTITWQQQGYNEIKIAVNLSPRQFNDENLVNDIASVLQETSMPSYLLELEITESMVMYNITKAIKLITELKTMGINIAIDDFGTGYSSLAVLKQFPIDTLKIDRSFVKNIPNDAEEVAITDAIISMGKALNLKIVAEGVEKEEQLHFLRGRTCDEIQGFYFSKPLPADECIALFQKTVIV